MPALDADVSSVLMLHQRCTNRKALPCDGGVFDQPERIMALFDVIDSIVAKKKKQQAEDEESEMKKMMMEKDLPRGRHC